MSSEPAPDAVADAVVARVGAVAEATARAFTAAYTRRLAPDPSGTGARSVEALAAEVGGALALALSRGRAPSAVRAFTPSLQADGYECAGSVLETNSEDLPFLVDSVTAELQARGFAVRRDVHPIIGTDRDAGGALLAVCHPRAAARRESVMHFELDRHATPEQLADLEDVARARLAVIARVVEDFPRMRERVTAMAGVARGAAGHVAEEDVAEAVAFLHWLCDEHFVFLGAREYAIEDGLLREVPGSGIGLLGADSTSAYAEPMALADMPESPRRRVLEGELLSVAKTNRSSPVHKRERMDDIGVRRLAEDGSTVGFLRLLGLFTTRAYAEHASATPLLHRKLARILDAEDLIEGSHDYKAAVALFDAFPKDELFNASVDDLRRAVVALLVLHGDDVRLLARRGTDGVTVALIVALGRAADTAALRERLRKLFAERFGTPDVDVYEALVGPERVQLHYRVHAKGGLPEVPAAALQDEVRALARTWGDRMRDLLVRRHGGERGRILAARWGGRLPDFYKASSPPAIAVEDIACFERVTTGAEAFVVGLQDAGEHTRVAFYKRGGKVELTQATALLEHLGLRVIEEIATRLRDDAETWVQGFLVLGRDDRPLALEEVRERAADALVAAYNGAAESDTLNGLVIGGGLTWRQVEVLRAYRHYRQRIGSRYTEAFQNDAINAHPVLTAKLMRYFELRFDPAAPADEQAEAALREEIVADLEAIELLDHDRILRNQLGAIEATVRTNVFRPGRTVMAFKLRSADVPAIPRPAPLFEIYVDSPAMEGIHLRGGAIARGGLRWSERMDYRTEVYGLLRAQMTKNAVIVPAGAKGGFLLKRAPAEPGALREEVRRQYVAYIGALLDVTDNLVDGTVVAPEGVRVRDGEDTYLVVAADKGTATFSDTANQVAVRRGFWLGDAFASGGSTGYDHKALGITARGAWESVKRHFRELGLDPATDAFSAIGIGDMSGDVFGNGMLLSDRMRLIAAYDHRHVFIDPDPDPGASFAERRRLFDLPGSTWDDYDRGLLSEGGGVFGRGAKSIRLSASARAALGIAEEALAPAEVIRAVLRAPVDLLFNGGIGTVVKASTETDADAQDRASDAIRVDARDVRCRAVAEGGNLGFTHRARIEYAAGGGLINADFIDNSAGVDCSDHEVNLKVLLDLAVRRGLLDGATRDALLADVTEDVVGHVLYDSFQQAQTIALQVRGSALRMDAYEDLMVALENEGDPPLLDRAAEALPAPDEMAERRRAGRGLERPELAVLLAYAKRSLAAALLRSGLPDDPALERDLRSYFPEQLVARFGALLAEHPLRRELVATVSANRVVDALGPTFASELVAERGADPAAVVWAVRVARDVTGADARWEAIERLGLEVEVDAQSELMVGADALVADVTRWYLTHPGEAAHATAARAAFEPLAEAMGALRSEEWCAACAATAERLVQRGVPAPLARAQAALPAMVHAPDIIAVAREAGVAVEEVARGFFALGDGLRLDWLEREIDALPVAGRMQRWAAQAVRDDVLAVRARLVREALEHHAGAGAVAAAEAFLESRGPRLQRLASFTRALAVDGSADLAGVTLAVRQLRALAG